ncbi:NAD(P)H-dependent oxidoreductase [Tamlana sp. 2_MG-2023]|uniref:NAD(P)H-dependent oxidoreductase n=1 Tax=unclassified Tamlana TaxID=2614803 RepID=UPI0026E15F0B|nr:MULTISPECIES: NAD(P)H-dependent oxidoreductase [unclassified Tamlana]MDO6761709.1 NAD(P)H-dependent oxidoreductase [Tamlana sp. 2_MG-2023]MDO6792263.1 NAD(P)H-dependent oxidoreductase [Tamlana sp. 1_MG-2023]
MKILVILAHPEEKSFNASLFNTTINTLENVGHEVKSSDLYKMNFQPVSGKDNFSKLENPNFFKQQTEELFAVKNNTFLDDIVLEQEKVEWCDIMIWHFPLYWFSVPAILKGWVDKVFTMGKFYDNGRIYENGYSVGKRALMSLTTGGPRNNYTADKYGDINSILFPIHRGIFEFLGFKALKPEVIYSTERLTEEERKNILKNWSDRLTKIEIEFAANNN